MINNSKKLRNCDQKRCGYIIMGIGCRECDTCQAEPYILDDNCYRCWNCSKDEGILRWNDNDFKIEEKQLQVVKMK